jgi:hypothetical protein
MHAMFWLPNRSTWVAPIITWRLPFHSTEHLRVRVPRLDDGARRVGPGGSGLAAKPPNPSVITRSGSKVSRASRPPIIGMMPMGLQSRSPSPRNASATATQQTSARVASSL